jgi:hypothetical protein
LQAHDGLWQTAAIIKPVWHVFANGVSDLSFAATYFLQRKEQRK